MKKDEGWEEQLKKDGVVLLETRNANELEAKPSPEGAVHVPCPMSVDPKETMDAAVSAGKIPLDKATPILVF